jgi:hypothetical protein
MWTCQKKKKNVVMGKYWKIYKGSWLVLNGMKWYVPRGEPTRQLTVLQNYVDKIWIKEVPSNIQHIVNQERYALFVQSCFSRYFYMK